MQPAWGVTEAVSPVWPGPTVAGGWITGSVGAGATVTVTWLWAGGAEAALTTRV